MRVMRRVAIHTCACLAALFAVAGVANASAAAPFTKAWGYGVSTGAAQFETCTTSCQVGVDGNGAGGAVWYPMGAAVSPTTGDIFVTNGHHRVEVYSPSGGFERAFGGGVAGGSGPQVCTTTCSYGSFGTGPGELPQPWGIAVDGSGNVVVSDYTDNRVSVFTEAGAYLSTFGSGVLNKPRGVALDGSGNVFVVDSANSRVVEYTLAGAFVRAFGADGTGAGQLARGPGGFGGPDGIGVGPSGNVIVSDTWNNRVDEFSPTGSFIRAFGYGVSTGATALEVCTSSCRAGLGGAGAGQLEYPAGLAVDATGRILVSDNFNARINLYTETGSFLRSFGSPGSDAGELAGAVELGVDGAGKAIVADVYNHRVDVFDYRVPTVALDQPSLSFGVRTTGTTSSSMTVTLTNGGDADLSLSGVSITGADADQFSRPAGVAGGTCDTSTPVAPSASCTVKVVFAPTRRGPQTAALTIASDTLTGTDSVTLSGTGQGPVVSFDQPSLSFGTQSTGWTGSPVTVTVTNSGETPLSLSALAITGPDAAHFARAGGTCDLASPVAAGASCTIAIVFVPTSDGTKNAALSLSSNAPAGVAPVPLSGIATAPSVHFDRSELAFGGQTVYSLQWPQIVFVTNTGNSPLSVTSIAVTGADAADFQGANDGSVMSCTTSTVLPQGVSCMVQLYFIPRTAGLKTASLSIGVGSATPYVVALSGTGLDSPGGDSGEAPADPPSGGEPQQPPTDPVSEIPRPKLTAVGVPAVEAKGTGFRVDPGMQVDCPMGAALCKSVVTATATMAVPGHKGRNKQVVVGRASVTTREGSGARLAFVLTAQGASVLRKLGRLRLAVTTITTAGNGVRATTSRTFTVKRPRARRH
jgi:hypothetical protein